MQITIVAVGSRGDVQSGIVLGQRIRGEGGVDNAVKVIARFAG